jgi:hypothetical protein
MKALLYSILWIAAGVGLYCSTLYVMVSWNLFTWAPSLEWEPVLCTAAALSIVVFMVWVAKRTRGYIATVVSLLACVALVLLGIFWFVEFLKEPSQFNGMIWSRRSLSPIWFRITFLSLFLIPLIAWFCYPFRYLLKNRSGHREGV